MDEQEEKDLQVLKEKSLELKLNCFDYMAHLIRVPQSEINIYGYIYGYKSIEDGLKKSILRTVKQLETLANEHVKKYPDEH